MIHGDKSDKISF